MTKEIDVDTHKSVGPVPDMYGHGPVILIGAELAVCLDCGYTAGDNRLLAHVECDRDKNPINTTLREHIEDGDNDGFPDASNPDEWPIE